MTAPSRPAIALGLAVLCLSGGTHGEALAQGARLLLEQGHQAYDFAEFARAIPLFSAGLNPTAGPRDAVWSGGVHKLAHALLELGQASRADVWLRWALRLKPDLVVDEIDFPPAVVGAFAAARDFVRGSPLDSAIVRPNWEWSLADASSGALLIQRGPVTINARIEGGDFLSAGSLRVVPPASYSILATAAGYLPARATVEVLPGVTTVLTFKLSPAQAGLLYVASRPWGTVYVDGERIGYTTVAGHRLRSGSRRVRIERDGYFPFDTTITVADNQSVRLGPVQLRRRAP